MLGGEEWNGVFPIGGTHFLVQLVEPFLSREQEFGGTVLPPWTFKAACARELSGWAEPRIN